MTEPLITRFSPSGDLFPHALADAVQTDRIFDPDFALAQDPAVYVKIRRDPVISHAIEFRKHLIAGNEWHLEPASESVADKEAAGIMEEILSRVTRFSEARFNLAEAVIKGSAYEFIEGRRERINLGNREPMDWWVPNNLKEVDKRRFRLINVGLHGDRPILKDGYLVSTSSIRSGDNGETKKLERKFEWRIFNTITREYLPFRRDQFVHHVYDDIEEGLGFGRGLASALYNYHRAKTIALQEGLMGLERWAQGFVIVKVDTTNKRPPQGQTNTDVITAAKAEFIKHKARHYMFMDASDSVEAIPWPGQGAQIIRDFLQYLDDSIRQLILGSTLPTGGGGPKSGSLARAQVEERSTEALIAYDRKILEETLERDLLGLTWKLNRQNLIRLKLNGARRPFFRITSGRSQTPQEAIAIITAGLGSGIKFREDEVYSKIGFTPPQEGDKIIEAPAAIPAEQPTLPFSETSNVNQITASRHKKKRKRKSPKASPYGK